jgi:hypothetical protein
MLLRKLFYLTDRRPNVKFKEYLTVVILATLINLLGAGCWVLGKDVLNLHFAFCILIFHEGRCPRPQIHLNFAFCILQSDYSMRGVAPKPNLENIS